MDMIQSINLIAINPQVRNGRPVIAGTGVCISDIVMTMRFQDQNTDELAAWYDLSLAQVHAALAYYYEHKAEIDAEIRDRLAKADQIEEERFGSRDSLLPG